MADKQKWKQDTLISLMTLATYLNFVQDLLKDKEAKFTKA